MDISIFDNKILLISITALASVIGTILAQRVLNKRGRFRYSVVHNRIGISADDAVFGSVRVTWNNTQIANLYVSTIELVNESLKDYADITVRVFTNNTSLLTDQTEIVGTTRVLNWTQDFAQLLHVKPGEVATDAQFNLATQHRDYLIPTMNRGQMVRFSFLNAAKTQNQPLILLDILHPGVKLESKVTHNQIWGVAQPTAALVGSIVGLLVLATAISWLKPLWLAAVICFGYGLIAQIPGALIVRGWRWLRNCFGG